MAKLLVVDDEPGYRESLQWMLSACNHEVEIAGDCAGCITTAQRFHPDVLIVDYMLKDHCSGLDLAQSLSGSLPYMKTIVMTGYPCEELRTHAAQFFAVLEKPFFPDELCLLIEQAMQRPHGLA